MTVGDHRWLCSQDDRAGSAISAGSSAPAMVRDPHHSPLALRRRGLLGSLNDPPSGATGLRCSDDRDRAEPDQLTGSARTTSGSGSRRLKRLERRTIRMPLPPASVQFDELDKRLCRPRSTRRFMAPHGIVAKF